MTAEKPPTLAIKFDGAEFFTDETIRLEQFPTTLWLVEGHIPFGYFLLAGPPKTGKTAWLYPLAQQLAKAGYRVLYLSLDDTKQRIQTRAIKASPEQAFPNLDIAFFDPTSFDDSAAKLVRWMTMAREHGNAYDVVFVDTEGMFVQDGNRTAKESVYNADNRIGKFFKQVSDDFTCAVIASTHTRKGGEGDDWTEAISGTTGKFGGVDAMGIIRRTRRSGNQGTLRIAGNDMPDIIRPVFLDSATMSWRDDTSVTVAQAEHGPGAPRDILDIFAEDPRKALTLKDLLAELDGRPRETVRTGLKDLMADNLVYLQGLEYRLNISHPKNNPIQPWRIVPAAEFRGLVERPADPPTPVEGPTQVGPCGGCGLDATYQYGGEPWHVVCKQRADDAQALEPEPEQPPRGELGVIGPDEPTEAEAFKAFDSLNASIRASRKHPVPLIARDKRDAAPWNLISERMSGEHKFRVQAPEGCTVKVLDRRGSYPSAMSNVPVSANLMTHTGPLDVLDKTRAGIYLVTPVLWLLNDKIGHPLGKIYDPAGEPVWVSTPHMRLLERLADQGLIERPQILDSWTGLAATNLFEQFYVDVRKARKVTVDDEAARAEVKRMSSVAIRALWLKNERLRSPFWRPDWSVSVRAEASVRHWAKAFAAVQKGATLVGLRQVDEASFVIPEGVPLTTWVPSPYVVGEDYGQVSVKSLLTDEEWNGGRR